MYKKNTGQNLTELSLCIVAIGMALVSMQLYIQRALQARLKAGTDYCITRLYNEAVNRGQANLASSINRIGYQYDPYYRESSFLNETTNSDITKGQPDRSGNSVKTTYGNYFSASAGRAD